MCGQIEICAGCEHAKSHRKPFGHAKNRSMEPIGRVHTDLCGPMPTLSVNGAKYILTFIDDATRYITTYFIDNKSDTFDRFRTFKAFAEMQSGRKLKILRSDGGGEYVNTEMRKFLIKHGIHHEMTTPDTPQQNGVAK